jgi:Tfp pilus assembly protein FimT
MLRHRLSIRIRLARLEAVRRKQVETASREAFILLGSHVGQTHLEMTSSDGGRCWFSPAARAGEAIGRFSASSPW